MKNPAFDGGSVVFMAATSASVIGSNYKNGKGTNSEEFGFGYNRYYKQKPKSQLLKLDLTLSDFHALELSARDYRNTFTRRDIQSNDYYVKYHYTPFSELVDLNVMASSSRGNQKYMPEALPQFRQHQCGQPRRRVRHPQHQQLPAGRRRRAGDRGRQADAQPATASMWKAWFTTRTTRTPTGSRSNPLPSAPSGRQRIDSLYASMQYNRGILSGQCRPELHGFRADRLQARLRCACENASPRARPDIALKEHGINPSLLLSAQLHPWFQPFASAERTMRGPNPQLVFFSNDGGASMNPFLKGKSRPPISWASIPACMACSVLTMR